MVRLVDMSFKEASRVIDRWEVEADKAIRASLPLPSLGEERFRNPPNSSSDQESEARCFSLNNSPAREVALLASELLSLAHRLSRLPPVLEKLCQEAHPKSST
jgi:hypothetical protein